MRRIATVRDLGQLIRAARRARGWSQGELAERSGSSRSFISDVETGKPTVELGRVLAVAAALRLDVVAGSENDTVASHPTGRPVVDLDDLLRSYRSDP